MSSVYKKELQENVSDAHTVKDLMPFLGALSLDKLKDFINQNVDEFNASESKTMYFNSVSIDKILPDDIIQYILSFQSITDNHKTYVSKQWEKLSNQNERNYYLQLQSRLDKNGPIRPYNKTKNNTWIIHPTRTQLTKVEEEFGFKGPINDIVDALDSITNDFECQSGDRLIIHEGVHNLHMVRGTICTDLSIIGVGNEAIIRDAYGGEETLLDIGTFDRDKLTRIYFENITFDFSKSCCSPMHLNGNSKLWLNKCKLLFPMDGIDVGNGSSVFVVVDGIDVGNGSCLFVENCVFDRATTAIIISPLSRCVVIRNSTFRNCGRETEYRDSGENACIAINQTTGLTPDEMRVGNYSFVRLICKENVFENNLCYPIAERAKKKIENFRSVGMYDEYVYIDKCDRYRLESNIFKGYNGIAVENNTDINDANKIYFNDEPECDWDL